MSNSEPLNITPPAAPQVEKNALGSALMDPESLYVVMEQLQADDFYDRENQHIFAAIVEVFARHTEVDIVLVEEHLDRKDQLEAVGGPGYLSELVRVYSGPGRIDSYCEIIRSKSIKRRLIGGCLQVVDQAKDPQNATGEVLAAADRLIYELLTYGRTGSTHEGSEVIADALEHLLGIQGAEGGITGVPTGLDVDQLTAGWQNGDFIVVAARPSMGKTAFVLHSLKHAARNVGNVALCSLEMSYQSLGVRMIISEAGVDGQPARRGLLGDPDIGKIQHAASRLMDMGVIVDDQTVVDPARLRSKARSMIHKYDIKLFAVDYVQLLTSDRDNREQQVAEISRACKAIAKDFNIPVIGLSQLNRSCEQRKGFNKRPQLSDLRESGAIEQDADVVAFLFRPEYYGLDRYYESEGGGWAQQSTDNLCEIIISKQRNGPTGLRRLGYNKKNMNFYRVAAPTGMLMPDPSQPPVENYWED